MYDFLHLENKNNEAIYTYTLNYTITWQINDLQFVE